MTALCAAMQSQRTLSFSSMQVSLKGRWEEEEEGEGGLVAFTCRCFVELLSVGWRVRQSVGSRLRENCPTQKEQSGNCTFSHAFDTWTLWLDADLVTRTRQQQVLLFFSVFFFLERGCVCAENVGSFFGQTPLWQTLPSPCHSGIRTQLFPKQSCMFPLLTRPKNTAINSLQIMHFHFKAQEIDGFLTHQGTQIERTSSLQCSLCSNLGLASQRAW